MHANGLLEIVTGSAKNRSQESVPQWDLDIAGATGGGVTGNTCRLKVVWMIPKFQA